MFTVMIFLFFFFVGMMAMFWYQGNRVERHLQELTEEHAQLRVLLRALESRMDGVAALEKARGVAPDFGSDAQPEDVASGHDPLLHLSFDKTRESMQSDLNLNSPLKLE